MDDGTSIGENLWLSLEADRWNSGNDRIREQKENIFNKSYLTMVRAGRAVYATG